MRLGLLEERRDVLVSPLLPSLEPLLLGTYPKHVHAVIVGTEIHGELDQELAHLRTNGVTAQ